jgi:hypothetical protein
MVVMRRKFKMTLQLVYYKSALRIQKFTKGFLVHRKFKEKIHRIVIDKMMVYFRKLRIELHTNSKIIIWHAWRLYKRRKAAKAEKKKKAAEAKAKKQGKFGGARAGGTRR